MLDYTRTLADTMTFDEMIECLELNFPGYRWSLHSIAYQDGMLVSDGVLVSDKCRCFVVIPPLYTVSESKWILHFARGCKWYSVYCEIVKQIEDHHHCLHDSIGVEM